MIILRNSILLLTATDCDDAFQLVQERYGIFSIRGLIAYTLCMPTGNIIIQLWRIKQLSHLAKLFSRAVASLVDNNSHHRQLGLTWHYQAL